MLCNFRLDFESSHTLPEYVLIARCELLAQFVGVVKVISLFFRFQGASIIRMLQFFLGRDVFLKGLNVGMKISLHFILFSLFYFILWKSSFLRHHNCFQSKVQSGQH